MVRKRRENSQISADVYREGDWGVGAAAYSESITGRHPGDHCTSGENRTWISVPKASVSSLDNLTSPRCDEARTTIYPVRVGRQSLSCRPKGGWKTNAAGMERLKAAKRLEQRQSFDYIRFYDDFPAFPINNSWDGHDGAGFATDKLYVVQTNTKVIERCLLMTTDPGDLVLDPTCGSGTTAYVAEHWGRRWITIDTSRVALSLARTRLMAARFPYYLLADSAEGGRRKSRNTGECQPTDTLSNDIRKGFVYKRVPHVTLKSIANNPDIKEGMTREEIDAAIAKHAETETLFDQPFEDKGTHPRQWAVHRGEPVAPSHAADQRRDYKHRGERGGQRAMNQTSSSRSSTTSARPACKTRSSKSG